MSGSLKGVALGRLVVVPTECALGQSLSGHLIHNTGPTSCTNTMLLFFAMGVHSHVSWQCMCHFMRILV
jgi:hypothetical protein